MNTNDILIETIRDSIIGEDRAFEGPYGLRRVTYADYTASGRALSFIEDYIRDEVLPLYANTHTETSGTGLQTTILREEARAIIAESVHAGPDDVVLFCGSGATGAINKMVDLLNMRLSPTTDARFGLATPIPSTPRPVVFIGPYEHHSNELPWRESLADVIVIGEDEDGCINLAMLKEQLIAHQDRPLIIGSFSAASNVTGIGSRTRDISILLHRHNALSFWDFAAAAPYVEIEMNMPDGEDGHLAYKDAVFISPHKFIGGPGTPGLLIAKRHLFSNTVPTHPGGGTVSYVSSEKHTYSADPIHREESGTPAIIESIRCGLVFQLKEAVGTKKIKHCEHNFIQRAVHTWKDTPNLEVLGNLDAWRLSIVSFIVRHEDKYLHHNFIVALLNDLFGVQARGGCSCAGPYGHRLLGIDLNTSREFEREIVHGCEGIKPGWVRVNLNYFLSEESFDFILKSVQFVAEHGYLFLPDYNFDPNTGQWFHRERRLKAPNSLHTLSYATGTLRYPKHRASAPESELVRYLNEAHALVNKATQRFDSLILPEPSFRKDFERLRWFPLPHEILKNIQKPSTPNSSPSHNDHT